MKRITISKIILVAAFYTLYACAGIPLKDFEPETVDEQEIIEVVMKHESAWNKQDLSGFMATFHDSALIELRCGGPLVTVKESADSIKRIMAEYPRVKLINPRLEVLENEAVMEVTSTELGHEFHLFKLEMHKENGQWLITKEMCI